jgi:anaerobic dimethyl sulfoxide reductase subunit A
MDDVPMIQDRFVQSIMLSPEDAEKRGIADGDEVYAYNDYGCVKRPARVTKKMAAGVVALSHGAYYRPSLTETYEAWFDTDGDGVAEKHITPVDLGGNPNVITGDRNCGVTHPYRKLLGLNANGEACEVSREKPD